MRFRVRGKHVTTKLAAEMIVEAKTGDDAFRIAKALGVDADSADPLYEGEELHDRTEPRLPVSPPPGRSRALQFVLISGLVGTLFYAPAGVVSSALVVLLLVLANCSRTAWQSKRILGLSGRGVFSGAVTVLGLLIYVTIASTFSVVRILDQRETERGTTRIATLVAQARTAIEDCRNADARALLEEACRVREGEGRETAQRVLRSIELSEDTAMVRQEMLELTDAEFDALSAQDALPPSWRTGSAALDAQVLERAKSCLTDVAATRAQRKIDRERVEREERERVAREEEAAAARKVAEATERARVAETVREKMLADFKRSPVQVIADIQVRARRGEGYTADVTVTNLWHVRHKQIRLQDAQTLLASLIASVPSENRNDVRLNILDLNGNKVGGTDMWGSATVDD